MMYGNSDCIILPQKKMYFVLCAIIKQKNVPSTIALSKETKIRT